MERLLAEASVTGLVRLSDLVPNHCRTECDRFFSEIREGRLQSFQIESAEDSRGHTVQWTVWRVRGRNDAASELLAIAYDFSPAKKEHRAAVERLQTAGRLAGGIAHDFNNIVTGVLLYADLLLASPELTQQSRRYAEQIRITALQATGFVRQLLALTKPSLNQPQLLSLNDVVEGMKNMLARLLGEGIALILKLDTNLGLVRIDPTQAQQILLNLVLNSRDAMPDGGQITVSTSDCKLHSLSGDTAAFFPCALITVEDNGIGMDGDTRSHLFEPFFTTKAQKGTGLGLATVHQIVTGNGGLIHVDSEPGRGTRVNVLLPVPSEKSTQVYVTNHFSSPQGEVPSSTKEDS